MCLVVLVGVGSAAAGPAVPNALVHFGYHGGQDADMNLDGNGGLMAMTPYSATFLTNGPGGRGLDFDNDADFMNTGAVGQPDNYMNLFFGYFNAPTAGAYTFRNAGDNDRCGIWLDQDQDGIFESATPGLGSDRDEQLSWEDPGSKTIFLSTGVYMFAVTHREIAGGAGVDVRFSIPGGAEMIIKPSDPAQGGIWTPTPEPTTLTLLALGGLAMLRRRRNC